MTRQETADLFLEQIKMGSNIKEAAKATGDVSGIIDIIKACAISKEETLDAAWLAEHTNRIKAKDLENEKAKAAENLAALGKAWEAADDKQDLVEKIRNEYETLTKTESAATFITADQLMEKTFEPRIWIVNKLITTGLTILSGAPKIGKSWLMLSLAEAVSTGGNFLSEFKAKKETVLHLALEETERSIYERRKSLCFNFGGKNIIITTQWESGTDGLAAYLREHRDIKLVIIDTLQKFLPDIEDINDYAGTVKPLARLKKTADDLDTAILCVHHAKKGGQGKNSKGNDWMDSSLGSQGIVGTSDTTLVLQRDINKESGERLNTGKLYATGRSIREIFRKLKFDPDIGSWVVDGATPQNHELESPTAPKQKRIITMKDLSETQ
jgi:hypothetical protein